MRRIHLVAACAVMLFLGLPLVAQADPADRFTAAIAPAAVQPPGLGQYTISIANLPNSAAATSGSIAIPAGFVVDGVINPPQARIVSGPCTGTWAVTVGASSIDLAAPGAGSALCDRGVLAVTFTVLVAPLGDSQSTWTTALAAATPFVAQAQPVLAIDGTPPETAISGTPPTLTGGTASFSYTGSDGTGSGVTGFDCKLDNAAFAACGNTAGYSGLTDGSHTFSVRARDAAGNVDPTPVAVTWTVDVTPPETTISSAPPALSNTRTGQIAFAGTDAHAGVTFQCALDGVAFAACSSPLSYSNLGDGPHSFVVRAVDAVGNVDPSPANASWTIDATAPPSPVLTLAPSDPSGDSTPTFEFSDLDPTAAFRCTLDGGATVDCPNGAFTAPVLPDGHHTFAVVAVDRAGNASGATSYAWTIDTVSPLVTFNERPPLLTNQTTATFGFTSTKPASTFECSLDGATFSTCPSPKVYADLRNGSHTVAVRAVWLALVGPPAEYSWTVDLVPPQTTINSGPPAESTNAGATFTFAGSEAATFTCRLDRGGPAPCTSPTTYTGLGDGQHTFSVQAVDRAGNSDPTPATYVWRISGVGPPVGDLQPPANVGRLKRSVGYGVLRLTWRPPADADYDHVAVFVSTKRGIPPRTLVYTGKKQSYVKRRFQNGLYYRYLVISYDTSDNASGGSSASVLPSALLLSPPDGRVVRSAPRLRWTPVLKASFYNVQVYYRGRKVLSAWPQHARQGLVQRWSYSGRSYRLRQGAYSWFVWPGFGSRAKSHYGPLLGIGTFRVR